MPTNNLIHLSNEYPESLYNTYYFLEFQTKVIK